MKPRFSAKRRGGRAVHVDTVDAESGPHEEVDELAIAGAQGGKEGLPVDRDAALGEFLHRIFAALGLAEGLQFAEFAQRDDVRQHQGREALPAAALVDQQIAEVVVDLGRVPQELDAREDAVEFLFEMDRIFVAKALEEGMFHG